MSNKVKLALLIVLSPALSGCSEIYFPFFRNYSDQPVELIYEIGNYYKQENLTVKYKQEILPISKQTYKYLKDSLQLVRLPRNRVSLTIPAHSTVLFPRRETFVNNIVYLKQENKFDSIAIWGNDSLNRQFKYKQYGFPVASLYYYDYK